DQTYLIQATTNFVHWDNILTNLATSDFMDLIDADAAIYPYRFYRSALYAALGQVSSATISSNANISLEISGLNGRTYELQASTNLMNWQTIGTTITTNGAMSFTDPDAN